MKIAQVSLQFEATTTGGGGIHVEKITEHLMEMGYQVTVISIHTSKTVGHAQLMDGPYPYSLERRDGEQILRLLIDEGIAQPYEGGKEAEVRRIREFCDAVAWWLARDPSRFDVVHLNGHHLIPGYLAWKLHKRGFTVVSTVHFLESTLAGMEHFDASEETLAEMRRWEALSRYADILVTASPGMRRDLLEIMRDLGVNPEDVRPKMRMISSGIDESSLMPVSKVKEKLAGIPNPVRILTFCRLDPSKGVEFAIRGTALAAERTAYGLRLTVAGIPVGSYLGLLREEAERMIEAIPVDIRIFEAISTAEERNALLDGFQIYLFPTLNEPFGITVLEAGARGLMVITTDAVGPRYILDSQQVHEAPWGYVTDFGICAKRTSDPAGNLAHNLSQAIGWTLDHWPESAGRALAFRRRIEEKHTWRRVAEAYLREYEALVSQ
ncbi:MAG: glycosyltransferase family 4 protein [Chloroflexota bacterium]|nr:glycosyltransferase family 4 protein [Chloroflexota bacterium]